MNKIYHINFHVLNNQPLFQYEEYKNFIKSTINEIIIDKKIPCIEWNVAITHLHFFTIAFPDMPRSTMVQYIKGISAKKFFEKYPEMRADFIGGHLWQKGYDWVEVKTIDHFNKAIKYIKNQENRENYNKKRHSHTLWTKI